MVVDADDGGGCSGSIDLEALTKRCASDGWNLENFCEFAQPHCITN